LAATHLPQAPPGHGSVPAFKPICYFPHVFFRGSALSFSLPDAFPNDHLNSSHSALFKKTFRVSFSPRSMKTGAFGWALDCSSLFSLSFPCFANHLLRYRFVLGEVSPALLSNVEFGFNLSFGSSLLPSPPPALPTCQIPGYLIPVWTSTASHTDLKLSSSWRCSSLFIRCTHKGKGSFPIRASASLRKISPLSHPMPRGGGWCGFVWGWVWGGPAPSQLAPRAFRASPTYMKCASSVESPPFIA